MRALLVAFVVVVVAACVVTAARSASSAASLRAEIRAEVRQVEQAKTTLRFFQSHAFLLYKPVTKRRAWHQVALARERVIKGRARLAVLRARLERLSVPAIPHLKEWLCIHGYEGSWTDPDSPYYGGLQFDMDFQKTYGPKLLRVKGTADHWTPREQMLVAERAWVTRGFWPWPNTARWCGLL